MEHLCKQCSKPLVRKGPGPFPTYCSASCRARYNNALARADGRLAQWNATSDARHKAKLPSHTLLTCRHCSAEFLHPRQRGWHPKYCSPLCSDRAFAARQLADGRITAKNAGRRGPGSACVDCSAPLRTGAIRCNACNGDRPHIPISVRLAVYERDGWECKLCDLPVDPAAKLPDLFSASLDHVVPVAHGGGDEEPNLQLAHFVCNSRKQDRLDYVA